MSWPGNSLFNIKCLKEERIEREFFRRDPPQVARELLGYYLVVKKGRRMIAGKIVETEAYADGDDDASHATRFGKTKRTSPLFGEVGFSYVYSVYINSYCLNVVAHREGRAGAVLIRALEPVYGVDFILENLRRPKDYDRRRLLNGPAKLCKGLGIDKNLNQEDMVEGKRLFILKGERISSRKIGVTARINIPYAERAKDWLWRFIIEDSSYLSR